MENDAALASGQGEGKERVLTKLRPSGGYRETASFRTATIIYDGTYWFCEKFLDPRSRTVDQMVQAARSGRQNIAEGSRAAATSSQTELRLLNVARSSLEELLLDFEDYLRHRHLDQWTPDSPEALAVRRVAGRFKNNRTDRTDPSDRTDQKPSYTPWLEHNEASVRANALICLINQANYLLDRQIAALEKNFVEGGGYSEQLAAARMAERNRKKKADPAVQGNAPENRKDPADHIPACPACGSAMVLRAAKSGKNAGKQFWGCSSYPGCKGTAKV
jgi:restriction system protein